MHTAQGYTVGIICPLEVEVNAVRFMLDEEHPYTKRSQLARYICGRLGGHNVVIVTPSTPTNTQSKVATALATSDLKRTFPAITHLLSVGIGSGIPNPKNNIRLGDVVIATPSGQHCGVVQFDLGKLELGRFTLKGYLLPPPRELLDILPIMMSDHRVRRPKIAEFIETAQTSSATARFSRPLPGKDLLFRADYHHSPDDTTCDSCDRDLLVSRPSRQDPVGPVIHYGLILSGDTIMENATERDRIAMEAGGASCLDTTAAGVLSNFPCLVIRGICDYADSHANAEWRQYAAAAAAAVAREILEYIEPVMHTPLDSTDEVQPAMFCGSFNAQHGKLYNIGCVTSATVILG
ncbi:purine and uridine phosphorylase [Aspergillus ellipticus CBS 707.79]|uniref:Purine and uridine phosphorylase n=1 Tax=Aspergillus ellipticus CBS 707.79 TaxID=1448320 RepID=A0A319CUF8_9EURO|nr:purine and uridine phosphorylase [Aspergillus ellipticus CBS 707.79]